MKKITNKEKYGNFYDSPYKEKIEEIWNVLEKFPIPCQKSFLKNIKKLKFEIRSKEEIANYMQDDDTLAFYQSMKNKIYLENIDEYLNHELFHVASSTRWTTGVILPRYQIGNNINEGITEYFRLKSLHKDNTDTYPIDFFAVKTIIDIYGEQILFPYFKHQASKFYHQFGKNRKNVIHLDILLRELDYNAVIMDAVIKYIITRDLIQDETELKIDFKEDDWEVIISFIELNRYQILNKFNKEIETNEKYVEPYKIMNSKNKEAYLNAFDKYEKIQKKIFDFILKILITLGRDNNLSDDKIKEILIHNLEGKAQALKTMAYRNKKLIKKK